MVWLAEAAGLAISRAESKVRVAAAVRTYEEAKVGELSRDLGTLLIALQQVTC